MTRSHVAPDFDLQSHSIASDGTLPPAAVVARAAADGMRLMALTAHSTGDGVQEALAGAEVQAVLRCSPRDRTSGCGHQPMLSLTGGGEGGGGDPAAPRRGGTRRPGVRRPPSRGPTPPAMPSGQRNRLPRHGILRFSD